MNHLLFRRPARPSFNMHRPVFLWLGRARSALAALFFCCLRSLEPFYMSVMERLQGDSLILRPVRSRNPCKKTLDGAEQGSVPNWQQQKIGRRVPISTLSKNAEQRPSINKKTKSSKFRYRVVGSKTDRPALNDLHLLAGLSVCLGPIFCRDGLLPFNIAHHHRLRIERPCCRGGIHRRGLFCGMKELKQMPPRALKSALAPFCHAVAFSQHLARATFCQNAITSQLETDRGCRTHSLPRIPTMCRAAANNAGTQHTPAHFTATLVSCNCAKQL